jgi:ribosomal-protein-alanine N-acetyltransferase
MPFVSNNISLTSLKPGDAEAIYNCMQDKTISENTLRIPYPYAMEDAEKWLEDNLKHYNDPGHRKPQAIRNEEGVLIGVISVHYNYGVDAEKSEFGYWLDKNYRNKGIMTEAIKQFCGLVKRDLGLKILEAHVFAHNPASMRTLVKAGFTQTGFFPAYYTKGTNIYDAVKFEKQL